MLEVDNVLKQKVIYVNSNSYFLKDISVLPTNNEIPVARIFENNINRSRWCIRVAEIQLFNVVYMKLENISFQWKHQVQKMKLV